MAEPPPPSRRVVLASFLVDVSDIFINLIVAIVTGSAVIFAEMASGLADAVGSALLVIGEKRGRKPGNAEHPLGHRREVFFWVLLSAVSMLVLGTGLGAWRAIDQLLRPEPIESPWLAFAVLAIALCTNGWTVWLEVRHLKAHAGTGWRIWRRSSRPLVETAFFRDVLGVLSAVFGVLALVGYVLTGHSAFDAVGALIIAAITALLSIVLIARSRGFIAGRSASRRVVRKLSAAVMTVPEVDELHRLIAVHDGVDALEIELDVALRDGLDTDAVERTIDAIQTAVREASPLEARVRVELNPPT